MVAGEGYWLRSQLFEVQPGEDSETHPGCYGKSLAYWIFTALKEHGVDVEDVFPEDWGWCVTTSRRAFTLEIGCGNVQNGAALEDMTWHCFVNADVPFWKPWLWLTRRAEIKSEIARLDSVLRSCFSDEPRITLVAEP